MGGTRSTPLTSVTRDLFSLLVIALRRLSDVYAPPPPSGRLSSFPPLPFSPTHIRYATFLSVDQIRQKFLKPSFYQIVLKYSSQKVLVNGQEKLKIQATCRGPKISARCRVTFHIPPPNSPEVAGSLGRIGVLHPMVSVGAYPSPRGHRGPGLWSPYSLSVFITLVIYVPVDQLFAGFPRIDWQCTPGRGPVYRVSGPGPFIPSGFAALGALPRAPSGFTPPPTIYNRLIPWISHLFYPTPLYHALHSNLARAPFSVSTFCNSRHGRTFLRPSPFPSPSLPIRPGPPSASA